VQVLFHEDIPDEYVAKVFDGMVRAKQHTPDPDGAARATIRTRAVSALAGNIWMGVTVENCRFVHVPTRCG